MLYPVPALRGGRRRHRAHAAFWTGFLKARRGGAPLCVRFFRREGCLAFKSDPTPPRRSRCPPVNARGTMVMFCTVSLTACATLACRLCSSQPKVNLKMLRVKAPRITLKMFQRPPKNAACLFMERGLDETITPDIRGFTVRAQ